MRRAALLIADLAGFALILAFLSAAPRTGTRAARLAVLVAACLATIGFVVLVLSLGVGP